MYFPLGIIKGLGQHVGHMLEVTPVRCLFISCSITQHLQHVYYTKSTDFVCLHVNKKR